MTTGVFRRVPVRLVVILLLALWGRAWGAVQEVGPVAVKTLDERIDGVFKMIADPFAAVMFATLKIGNYEVLWVVLWLAGAGLVLTLAFGFFNLRALGLALRTLAGKYSEAGDPGEVTHFQALSAAVSGTVGLGNIAGVAIGIAMAGPGVAFWLFVSGVFGMSVKFAECTLGVKYRDVDEYGRTYGGGMYYLKKGFAERGFPGAGKVIALWFAVCCVFASFGGGNIFQINQATEQLVNVTGGEASFFRDKQWIFGGIIAALTALVILGGITGIARLTSKLVPAMCAVYIVSGLAVLAANWANVPAALELIVTEAFHPRPMLTGGALAVFVWGMRRATFSNEAGIGSAPIAHSAVKTRMPASEGVVALLEPFVDTVIVCTITSLVVVCAMRFPGEGLDFTVNGVPHSIGSAENVGTEFGILLTSQAFETVAGWFRYTLFLCVVLFAFSTLITWSYYGLQAWQYLVGRGKRAEVVYKLMFCGAIVVGSSATLKNALQFSDASLFAMSVPNLIGVYFLLPVIRRELRRFTKFARLVDSGKSLGEAEAEVNRAQAGLD